MYLPRCHSYTSKQFIYIYIPQVARECKLLHLKAQLVLRWQWCACTSSNGVIAITPPKLWCCNVLTRHIEGMTIGMTQGCVISYAISRITSTWFPDVFSELAEQVKFLYAQDFRRSQEYALLFCQILWYCELWNLFSGFTHKELVLYSRISSIVEDTSWCKNLHVLDDLPPFLMAVVWGSWLRSLRSMTRW